MDFYKEYFNLGLLDSLSYRNTFVHRLDPRTKVIATLAFLVTVVSFPKHEIAGLIPFFLFPVVILALGDIPVWIILKKILLVSPFAVFIGLFNPLMDPQVACHWGGISISWGWISFFSIILKFFLTVSAVLLLISTTSFPGISHALGKLGIPEIFIAQLLFLYRYIFVLMEETMKMVRARDLRSFGGEGRGIKVFVHLVGTLFMRTIERAERIYHAMLSRGFSGTIPSMRRYHFTTSDYLCLLATGIILILLRVFNLIELMGRQAERMF
jgi:cobalt/nickel transport system permease protein